MGRDVERIEYEQMLLSRYAIAQHRTDGGMDRSAYLLLSRLQVQGPMSIGELGAALHLDVSTLQRQTAAAMRAGLIERIPDPEGGIARKFRISEDGLERLAEARRRYVAATTKVVRGWSDADIAVFARLLRRFNEAIEHLRDEEWPREG